ncbi:MAG: ATP-dependent RNA helicase HrpA [Cellvibrionaceae bacterium]
MTTDSTSQQSISTISIQSIALDDLMLKDRRAIIRLQQDIQKRKKLNKPFENLEKKLQARQLASQQLVEKRASQIPSIKFPEELPIAQKREVIAEAIKNNQVVVVAGETGSGKTTQLPKICLELGRGVKGLIGHTQPRRIAARTVASRIAEELHVDLGELVGYQVRFTDHSNDITAVKLMTDGILLAEIQNDRFLNRYDTIIIDEAHERSLNIDFLLGYLKQLLPRRPDLKVIITSATIDVERLSKHFDNAPVVQVSGRTYPVDVHYRPTFEDEDLPDAIVNVVSDIVTLDRGEGAADQINGGGNKGNDILVFLSGERDIRETALALRKAQIKDLEVVPLYARLSLSEQAKVFQSHRGVRVVLATNVAETSITVPGIRYVIDPGYARISRYSYRTKIQRLPIEAISQASANQRKGRSGRVSNGVCFRLYEEADFNSRPEFTEPEILRSNLATVILQMAQLRLGNIHDFPFVEKPDRRLINDGYKLLEELQAIDSQGGLSALGRQLTQFSVDPKFARMCIAANQLGCLRELLIIVSLSTIQDPRERPADKQQAADEKHRRFWEEGSDFLSSLKLWDYVEEQRQDLSQSQFRRLCKKEFLSYLRLREWRDLHHQLRLTAKQLGLVENKTPANLESVHRALITGLLGNIGMLTEDRIYLGPRNRKFSIFPGSSLFKKTPKWIVAGELIETTKLYAHNVAKVESEWILAAANHLVKKSHFEPHYDAKRGQVMVYERVSLYGVMLVEKRRVSFSDIDPEQSREIFIQAALVEGNYKPPRMAVNQNKNRNKQKNQDDQQAVKFWLHNAALFKELEELEAKSRRRDILVEDKHVFEYFNERVPANIVNLKGFEYWRKQAEKANPEILCLPRDLLMQHAAVDVTQAQFPNELTINDQTYRVTYHFEPGTPDDGVSLHVPIHGLHLLLPDQLEWLVPGMLREKCIQLVKSLPKQWRKNFVPVPDVVDRAMPYLSDSNKNTDSKIIINLVSALQIALQKVTAVHVDDAAWQNVSLDPYYLFNIKVVDDKGKVIDSSRQLDELRERYRGRLQDTLRSAGESIERDTITTWDFDKLPETYKLKKSGMTTIGYPTLVDNGKNVDLRLVDDHAQAELSLEKGVARLLIQDLGQEVKYLKKNLFRGKNMALRLAMFGKQETLVDDLLCAAVKQVSLNSSALPRDKISYELCLKTSRENITKKANELEKLVLTIADTAVEIRSMIDQRKQKKLFVPIEKDIVEQLYQLTRSQFLFYTPEHWIKQYPRFLQGIVLRIKKSDAQIQKDMGYLESIKSYTDRLNPYWQSENESLIYNQIDIEKYRWMLEEFRLSLFAQPMKTSLPVSEKRLDKQWAKIAKEFP